MEMKILYFLVALFFYFFLNGGHQDALPSGVINVCSKNPNVKSNNNELKRSYGCEPIVLQKHMLVTAYAAVSLIVDTNFSYKVHTLIKKFYKGISVHPC